MNPRLLLTFGAGEHAQLLELSRPRFQEYAKLHSYDYGEVSNDLVYRYADGRPLAWAKLPAMADCFKDGYVSILWIDCDVLIRRADLDIWSRLDHLPAQAMVCNHTTDGEVPSTGVWIVTREMLPWLDKAWQLYRDMPSDPWWEQAAIMRLMGYKLERPTELVNPTELHSRTAFLPLTWNSHPWDSAENPRFQHFTPGPVAPRVAAMRKAIEEL